MTWTQGRMMLLVVALALPACELEEEDDEGGSTTTSGTGDGSGASQLGASHPGYEDPCCLDCHVTDSHNEGKQPAECAGCHGTNGAPSGHGGDAPCADCHGNVHSCADSALPDPTACQTCHGGSGGEEEEEDD